MQFFANAPPAGILDRFRFARVTAATIRPVQRPQWFLLAALLQ
jgi:hypothetical protein